MALLLPGYMRCACSFAGRFAGQSLKLSTVHKYGGEKGREHTHTHTNKQLLSLFDLVLHCGFNFSHACPSSRTFLCAHNIKTGQSVHFTATRQKAELRPRQVSIVGGLEM